MTRRAIRIRGGYGPGQAREGEQIWVVISKDKRSTALCHRKGSRWEAIGASTCTANCLKAGETQVAGEAMELFPGDYPDDWAEALLTWTKVHFPLPDLWDIAPDYSAVSDVVRDERLEGLRKFVDHSGCDGRHSRGDVADIAALFEQVQPDADEVLKLVDHVVFERVARFFIAARDAHEFITYC